MVLGPANSGVCIPSAMSALMACACESLRSRSEPESDPEPELTESVCDWLEGLTKAKLACSGSRGMINGRVRDVVRSGRRGLPFGRREALRSGKEWVCEHQSTPRQ